MEREIISMYIPCNPPTAWGKNSKNAYNGRVVTNRNIASTKSLMVGLLAPKAPKEPLQGPLRLNVMVVWPFKKTERKSITQSGSHIPKITRPDGDNVLATIKDVMESLGYFNDDSQIYCEHIERWHGPKGFIRIILEEVNK